MANIKEILQLPKEEQIAIMEAIQDNLDEVPEKETLSDEHIAFIKERIRKGESYPQTTYSSTEI